MSRSKQPLTIELAILGFLQDRPLHSYELYQRLSAPDALGSIWPLKQSQLYALVARLEAEGLLTMTLELRGTLAPRKLLRLTERGTAAFTTWLHATPELGEEAQRTFLARLYFARQLGPAALRRLLLRERQQCRAQLHALHGELANLVPQSYPWLVGQWRVRQAEAALDWIESFGTLPQVPGVSYPIAVVADSPAAALAQQFVAYVCGPAGQAVLAHFGFLLADEPWADATTTAEQAAPLSGSLVVYGASSLSAAFEVMGAAFNATHPDVRLHFTFGGSQTLADEVAQGAPVDVYAPAHHEAMARVISAGRVAASAVRTFAHNQLAIVTPAAGRNVLQTLDDLARPGLRLALGSAATAIGRYTQDILDTAAQYGAFGADGSTAVLHNVVFYAETVTGVLSKVARGEVDAGIVFSSDYHRAAGAVQVAVVPPLPRHRTPASAPWGS